jgi:hypothetical protein
MFLLWVLSIVMMFVNFHWGWLVAFIIVTLYFLIRYAGGEGMGSAFDGFDFFD